MYVFTGGSHFIIYWKDLNVNWLTFSNYTSNDQLCLPIKQLFKKTCVQNTYCLTKSKTNTLRSKKLWFAIQIELERQMQVFNTTNYGI